MIHLELVEGSDNLYVLKPGRVWTESLKAVIFQIDIVYDSSKKAYELRMTPDSEFCTSYIILLMFPQTKVLYALSPCKPTKKV